MSGSGAFGSLRVLLVDDREESRYLFGTWLRRSGFEVHEAHDGATAIELLQANHFDIAVLDVNLPDMSGFEISESIRATAASSAMGVIHVSATAVAPSDRSEGLLRGADAFLIEPIEPSDLLATITALIRRSGIRQRLDLTARRLRILNRVTADVHAASNDSQLFAAVVHGVAELGETGAMVVRRDRNQSIQSKGDGTVSRNVDPAASEQLFAPAVAGASTVYDGSGALGPTPLVGVPFVDETGEPFGALLIPEDVDGAQAEVVPMLAQLAVSLTLARANISALDIEHRMALVLQQSLLPQQPPRIPGLTVEFRYFASSLHAEVGGDFYEAIEIDPGQLLFAIGDVVGHSLIAATVMGEIRHALRAFALEGFAPNEIIDRLDRLIRRLHPNMFTSMVCGLIDTTTDHVALCNAGHLPPLLVESAGAVQFIRDHGPLLGLDARDHGLVTFEFPAGSRLVLVTDGLVERRGESLDAGLQRLAAHATEHRAATATVAIDEIIAAIGPAGTPEDDVALMIIDRWSAVGGAR